MQTLNIRPNNKNQQNIADFESAEYSTCLAKINKRKERKKLPVVLCLIQNDAPYCLRSIKGCMQLVII